MQKYRGHIQQILSKKEGDIEAATKGILSELKMCHGQVSSGECLDLDGCPTAQLFRHILVNNTPQLYQLMRQILELLYLKVSPMLEVVYQVFPLLLRNMIDNHQHKHPQLEMCLRVICMNEAPKYYQFLRQRSEQANSQLVKSLYSIHFNQPVEHDPLITPRTLERMQEDSRGASLDRRLTKTILLFRIYREVERLGERALRDYLQAIYIYCGGEGQVYTNVSSFYLLEKKNLFNVFKHFISENELQWMLLCLYQLSIDSPRLKYELLAAINMIYKKTANQSMFRFSEIAQSIIHILEDEYSDIFD